MNGFGLHAKLQSIRVLDMLLRRADRMIPFLCVYEENQAVLRWVIAKRYFARVAMPSREMLAMRAEQLKHAEGGSRPFVFVKPTMATFLGSADEVCANRARKPASSARLERMTLTATMRPPGERAR